jgi:transitional endoplasmic reticulum ATPase
MKTYSDQFLESLRQVYEKNPDDINFKKYFAFELYKRNEVDDALELFRELIQVDNDLNIEKAIKEIEAFFPKQERTIGLIQLDDEELSLPEEAKKFLKKETTTFADIAGMDEVKEAIRTDIIYPFQHPEVYKKYNKKAGGGILLFGPPGCGKTFIAKATAGEIDAKFYAIHIHELISSFAGEGERALHYIFSEARETAPSVLFFDEIDAIGMSRSKTSGVLRTLVNQFLTELDGISSDNQDMLIIGATNLPWEVDSALRRPGRFDKVLFVTPPDKKARTKLFELSLRDKPLEEINYEKLAEMTRQYSAADITRICDEASEIAFKNAIKSGNNEPITQRMLEEVTDKVKSSITEWFNTVRNYIQYSNDSGMFNEVDEYLKNLKNDR